MRGGEGANEVETRDRPSHQDRRKHKCTPALRAQQVGVRAQGLRHAGAEPVALDDEPDQRLQVVGAVAVAERPERVRAAPPVAQLESHQRELVAQDVRDRRSLLAHPGDGSVEPEARLETHDHQVERVGQRRVICPTRPRVRRLSQRFGSTWPPLE